MKKCFKCNLELPLTEFYRHKLMKDGYLGKCKNCTKKDVQNRYKDPTSKKYITAYEKRRFKNPDRKKKLMLYQKKRRRLYPDKNKARALIYKMLVSGKIVKEKCLVCGDPKTEAHHTNYTTNEYQWLCRKHHLIAEGKQPNNTQGQ